MTRDKFLTVRWNNMISLGLGLIVVVYVAAMVASAGWSGREGFIGLAAIGVVF